MNTVCKIDNNHSAVFEETFNFDENLLSILHDTFGEILQSFYAPDVSILHKATMPGDDRFPACDHCIFHRNIGFKTVTNPLIACAAAPVVPTEHPITEMYEPYICLDGSLIAMAQMCDGKRCANKPVTTMLTYPWKCTVLHCNHLGNTCKPLVLMTRHFDYCPSAISASYYLFRL